MIYVNLCGLVYGDLPKFPLWLRQLLRAAAAMKSKSRSAARVPQAEKEVMCHPAMAVDETIREHTFPNRGLGLYVKP